MHIVNGQTESQMKASQGLEGAMSGEILIAAWAMSNLVHEYARGKYIYVDYEISTTHYSKGRVL